MDMTLYGRMTSILDFAEPPPIPSGGTSTPLPAGHNTGRTAPSKACSPASVAW